MCLFDVITMLRQAQVWSVTLVLSSKFILAETQDDEVSASSMDDCRFAIGAASQVRLVLNMLLCTPK